MPNRGRTDGRTGKRAARRGTIEREGGLTSGRGPWTRNQTSARFDTLTDGRIQPACEHKLDFETALS